MAIALLSNRDVPRTPEVESLLQLSFGILKELRDNTKIDIPDWCRAIVERVDQSSGPARK